jgi:hypothetical protein
MPAFLNRALMQVCLAASAGCLTQMLLIEKVGVRIDVFGPPLPKKSKGLDRNRERSAFGFSAHFDVFRCECKTLLGRLLNDYR